MSSIAKRLARELALSMKAGPPVEITSMVCSAEELESYIDRLLASAGYTGIEEVYATYTVSDGHLSFAVYIAQ